MKRKILSLALALMMIVSVAAAMPVSADDVEPITLDITSDYVSAKSANSKTATPIDAPDWVTDNALNMNTASPYITWTFDVPETGAYDVYVAYACNAQKKASVYVGDSVDVIAEYNLNLGYNSDDANHDHPVVTRIATSVPFVKGADNKLKLAVSGGAVYNLRLEYVSGTDFVVPARSTDISSLNGANKSNADTGVIWGPKSGFWWSKGSSATYNVNVLEEGDYKLEFLAGAQNGTLKVDIYDNDEAVISNFSIVGPASTYQVSTTDIIHFTEGPHTIRLDRKSGGTYFMGFRFVYQIPEPDKYTITAAAEAGGTATANGAETATVEAGETVTLNATPDDGYAFIGWHDGTAIVDSNATYTVTVTETKTYTAKFQLTATVLNATEMTKSPSSGYHTTQTASPKNVSWAADTGYKMCTASFVGVKGNVTIDEDGWYDVTVAYGTSRSDVLGVVDFGTSTGYSVDLQALLPTTGAHATCNAASLGSIYLTAGDYPINVYLKQKVSSGWYATIYSIKIDESEAPSVVNINGGRPTSGSSVEVSAQQDWSNSGLPSWVNYGSARINGPSQSYTYTAMVPATGYYTVKIAVGATANTSPRINFAVDGVPVVEEMYINSATSGSNGNLQDVGVTTLTRVYLTEGSRTFTVSGVQNMHACRVQNILLVAESLPSANTLRITDDDDNALSYFAAGERVTAEVALDSSVEGANIFIVQYAGSGDEKTMVASTFTGAASSLAYSVDGKNFYRVKTTVASGATEIKAFVWKTDSTFAPLCGTESASVN